MTEEEKRAERNIARKFHNIGSQIGLKDSVHEYSFKFPETEEVLKSKEKLERYFDCSVSFSWARVYLFGINYSFTHVHVTSGERLYRAVKNQRRIYLNSYYYPAGVE